MAKRKNRISKPLLPAMLGVVGLGLFVLVVALLIRGKNVALLSPEGFVADEQYRLLIASTVILVGFAAVVLFFIYFFAWRYRDTGRTSDNSHPDQRAGRSKLLIFTAWAAPISIFVLLVSMMLPATQKLEPQRSIESPAPELTIRVVAMRWKWLFMYPEQDIATVNFVQIPVDTPVRFELTADEAPMNGFWIPRLGGMLYAMTEHVNPLNLMAHTTGDYEGSASEISGRGFADMRFTARVSSQDDFDKWVRAAADSPETLNQPSYAKLLEPSEKNPAVTYYSPDNQQLFDSILSKYAGGSHDHHEEHNSAEHE